MFQDSIIKKIREIRKEIEEDCKNDPEKYYEHILQLQKHYKNRLVCRKPKPALQLAKVG